MKIALALLASIASVAAAEPEVATTDWKLESESKDVVIHSRSRAGSALKEFRAVGSINAQPAAVFAVIDDAESYPSFMPYTAEAHILLRTRDSTLTYERLKFPLLAERDFTILSRHTTSESDHGTIHRMHWQTANERGPAPKSGVIRIGLCEGGWVLEPKEKDATTATYTVFSDSGGAIPAFLANSGSQTAIRKVFEAIRKRLLNPKFTSPATTR